MGGLGTDPATDLLPRPVVTERDVGQRALLQLGRATWDGTRPLTKVDRGRELKKPGTKPGTKPRSSMDDASDTRHHTPSSSVNA